MMPNHSMQTAFLPGSTCDSIDKLNRNFLWGSSNERRKVHLVAWDKVCMKKNNGGLGLRHLKHQNLAFMSKLYWNMVCHKDELWVRVLRTKYRCGNDLLPTIDIARQGSNAWSGIKNVWKTIKDNIVVVPGSNSARWIHSRNGVLTVSSAYDVFSSTQHVSNNIWQKVWKLHTLQKCKCFMWLSLQNKLLSNVVRKERGLCSEVSCEICGAPIEDLLHILRNCDHAMNIWRSILNPSMMQNFCSLPLFEWLCLNIINPTTIFGDEWSEFFTTIYWGLWARRNTKLFEGKWESNESIILRVRSMLSNLKQTEKKLKGVNLNGTVVRDLTVRWTPPMQDWVKLNVDGAFSRTHGLGCGGLLRRSDGSFVEGFMFHPNHGDSLTAELWALVLGLKLAWQRGYHKVIVETDASEVIHLLERKDISQHADFILIQEAKSYMCRTWDLELVHISRTTNTVADALPKHVIGSVMGYQPILVPSPFILTMLHSNCNLFSSTSLID